MQKEKLLKCLLIPLILCSTACNNNESPSNGYVEPENAVTVIVMSGQSNMEGSTYYDNGKGWLRNYLNEREIDADPFFNGINEVQTSFRGYYPYGGWGDPAENCHASNTQDRMAGKFLPTKVGMGNADKDMGPEIGLTHVIREKASAEKPIFLIKSAFSGGGFYKDQFNWKAELEGGLRLWAETKQFVHNNLKLIEDMGFQPIIKAWLWHQGETDTENKAAADAYYGHMSALLGEFREEFAPYARQEDGSNIAFVDCTIYDGTRLKYEYVKEVNEAKWQLSEDDDNNFIINASMNDEDGLHLEIGGNQNLDGCDNIYHYTTADCFRLGEAYGNILLEHSII